MARGPEMARQGHMQSAPCSVLGVLLLPDQLDLVELRAGFRRRLDLRELLGGGALSTCCFRLRRCRRASTPRREENTLLDFFLCCACVIVLRTGRRAVATSTSLLPKHRVVLQAMWERRHGKIALTECQVTAVSCGAEKGSLAVAVSVPGREPCLFPFRQAGTVYARILPIVL